VGNVTGMSPGPNQFTYYMYSVIICLSLFVFCTSLIISLLFSLSPLQVILNLSLVLFFPTLFFSSVFLVSPFQFSFLLSHASLAMS